MSPRVHSVADRPWTNDERTSCEVLLLACWLVQHVQAYFRNIRRVLCLLRVVLA